MISPRAPVIGLPTLRLSSWASSSVWSLMQGRELGQRPTALAGGPGRPSPCGPRTPAWAAATARSTSSRPPSGAVAMTVPVGRVDDVERLAVGGVDGLAADDHARRGARRRAGCGSVVIGGPRGVRDRVGVAR